MKIFVMLSRVPWPLEKGDKLRAWHQIRELSRHHEIALFCINDTVPAPDAEKELKKYCKEVHIHRLSKTGIVWRLFLALFSKLPFQVHYFHQRSIQRRVKKAIEEFKPDHIFCQLIRCSEYVKNIHHIPKTLDYMDAFSKGVERRIEKSGFFLRPFFRAEAKRLVEYENLIFDYFEHKCIITEQDRKHIYHPDQNQIAIVPNGVDVLHFHPIEREKKYDLVFNGNMNYPPNVDCVEFIVNDIMRKSDRPLSLLISGASPSATVLELASRKGVTVSGWVNDQRESYASGKIFIAPFRIGTGLQNKLLEAMSMGIPCITSALANNALQAKSGYAILVADKTEDIVQHIHYLLDHPSEAQLIAERGRQYIHEHFDWPGAVAKLESLFRS